MLCSRILFSYFGDCGWICEIQKLGKRMNWVAKAWNKVYQMHTSTSRTIWLSLYGWAICEFSRTNKLLHYFIQRCTFPFTAFSHPGLLVVTYLWSLDECRWKGSERVCSVHVQWTVCNMHILRHLDQTLLEIWELLDIISSWLIS